MTLTETASTMRSCADAIDKAVVRIGRDPDNRREQPVFDADQAVGAAAFLCYLRDCVTASPHETWSRGGLLVLLETCSRDAELFPAGVGTMMWDADDEILAERKEVPQITN